MAVWRVSLRDVVVLLAAGAAIDAVPAQGQPTPLQGEGANPSCVDVQVEGSRSLSFACLNQALKDGAGAPAAPVYDVKDAVGDGAPTKVGTFSYAGTSIRMGDSFGKSAIPQRPPAPSFTNALAPAGAK